MSNEVELNLCRVEQALLGEFGPEQVRLAEVGLNWLALLLRKNYDYGSAVFRPSLLAPELAPDAAIRVRMSDKISRLAHLLGGAQQQVSEETIADTIKDLGVYCLLWLARPQPAPAGDEEPAGTFEDLVQVAETAVNTAAAAVEAVEAARQAGEAARQAGEARSLEVAWIAEEITSVINYVPRSEVQLDDASAANDKLIDAIKRELGQAAGPDEETLAQGLKKGWDEQAGIFAELAPAAQTTVTAVVRAYTERLVSKTELEGYRRSLGLSLMKAFEILYEDAETRAWLRHKSTGLLLGDYLDQHPLQYSAAAGNGVFLAGDLRSQLIFGRWSDQSGPGFVIGALIDGAGHPLVWLSKQEWKVLPPAEVASRTKELVEGWELGLRHTATGLSLRGFNALHPLRYDFNLGPWVPTEEAARNWLEGKDPQPIMGPAGEVGFTFSDERGPLVCWLDPKEWTLVRLSLGKQPEVSDGEEF